MRALALHRGRKEPQMAEIYARNAHGGRLRITRRALLQRAAGASALVAAGGVLSACGGSGGSGAKSLNILSGERYDDARWLSEFKNKTGITVNATNVGARAEMLAK